MKNRKRGEEEAEADAFSNKGSHLGSVPPQRSEAASSKIASNTPSKLASNTPSKVASNTPSKLASNTPSKVIKTSQHSHQSKIPEGGSMVQFLPPNPKKISDSVAKVPSKSDSEIKVESISLVEY